MSTLEKVIDDGCKRIRWEYFKRGMITHPGQIPVAEILYRVHANQIFAEENYRKASDISREKREEEHHEAG